MKAVIMAGGLGTRLKPFTKVIPKSLLPVGEQSVLEIAIQGLKNSGFLDIYLAVNYKSRLFEAYFGDGSEWGVRIHYSTEAESLGTAGPLKLLRSELGEPFLVMNGDILTNLDFRRLRDAHFENGAILTLVTKVVNLPLHYGVVESDNEVVTRIEEKPVIQAEVNAGIYFVNPEVIELIPEGRKYDMTMLLQDLLSRKARICRFELKDYWLDIGQLEDYDRAQEYARQRLFDRRVGE